MNTTLQIHPDDNVAVLLQAQGDIPAGHKMALQDIQAGEPVVKYGAPIGVASQDIKKGDWVHTHNLKTALSGTLSYTYTPTTPVISQKACARTFAGYRRGDGRVGIRNEVWVIPTVGCVNAIVRQIASSVQKVDYPNLDGIHAFNHPYGCSQLGEDHLNTQKALAALAHHPNAGAVLIVGLGCENNTIDSFKEVLGPVDPERVKFLICQDVEDELTLGQSLLEALCSFANGFTRDSVPVSELIIGLKCGGSDGFSGITANPLLGRLTDQLTACGGSTILTEVPEMFGAETLLMDRCTSKEVFDDCVGMVNGFKQYFLDHGQPVGENPSPGNREGGITTLEEKSLGCTQKGGQASVVDVLSYAQPLSKKGLNLLEAPGNDLVATAALAFSGAQMVLFTTGRGTPFAGPVPTVKISSNSALAQNKSGWIDFDAGQLLSGKTMDTLADELLDYVIDLASGNVRAKSERLDKSDLAIFKSGVTL